jgi:hypothetical protein
MQRRTIGYATVAVLALLTVGACSASDNGAAKSARADGTTAGGSAAVGALAAPSRAAARPGTTVDDAGVPLATGAKIRTAQITVALKRPSLVATQATQAADIAIRVGGQVDSDDRTSGPHAGATLQLRVPPDAMERTLDALARLGTEKSRESSSVDVTEKVADVNSRVSSARDAIVRLRALYSHATKVGDVIAVEAELSQREADLESLQAQQRTLDGQTAMATITLSLVTAPRAVAAPAKKHSGFLGGLQRGWDGFTGAASWLAAALGAVLPFAALIIVLALAGRAVWNRLPRRAGPTPTPTPAE